MKIACVGEAMIELSGGMGSARIGFAGDVLNTAVYLHRALIRAHDVAFVSVLGRDRFSDEMVDFISAQGVSTSCIERRADLLPGLYAITTDDAGERSFLYWRENSAARALFQNGFGVLDGFDVIYFTAITLAILPARTRARFLDWLTGFDGMIVFDSNYRPTLWQDRETARTAIDAAWQLADVALPSLDDEIAIFGARSERDVLDRFARYELSTGALKRGAAGPVPIKGRAPRDNRFAAVPRIVDATAAGDSFNSGFIAAMLDGGSQNEAMLAGHRIASRVVAVPGAID